MWKLPSTDQVKIINFLCLRHNPNYAEIRGSERGSNVGQKLVRAEL